MHVEDGRVEYWVEHAFSRREARRGEWWCNLRTSSDKEAREYAERVTQPPYYYFKVRVKQVQLDTRTGAWHVISQTEWS